MFVDSVYFISSHVLNYFGLQAYDGHMNLILSDVEETIMIVDPIEGGMDGHGTVKVSLKLDAEQRGISYDFVGGQEKNGDVVRSGRWRHPGMRIL